MPDYDETECHRLLADPNASLGDIYDAASWASRWGHHTLAEALAERALGRRSQQPAIDA